MAKHIDEFDSVSSLTGTDLFLVLQGVGGSPIEKKLSYSDLLSALEADLDIEGGGGGATSLNDLDDVDVETPPSATGNFKTVLVYDGGQWVDSGLLLHDLMNVSGDSPSVSDVLTYDGTNWIPQAGGGGGGGATDLEDLTDVNLTAAGNIIDGQVLRYSQYHNQWVNEKDNEMNFLINSVDGLLQALYRTDGSGRNYANIPANTTRFCNLDVVGYTNSGGVLSWSLKFVIKGDDTSSVYALVGSIVDRSGTTYALNDLIPADSDLSDTAGNLVINVGTYDTTGINIYAELTVGEAVLWAATLRYTDVFNPNAGGGGYGYY